jgi:hypothetical protein
MARSVGVMNEEEARELALRELGSDSFVITDSKRIGRTWVINYQSRKYVETGNVLYMESGPGPIFVSDSDYVVRGPGTTRPTQSAGSKTLAESVAEFEQQQP